MGDFNSLKNLLKSESSDSTNNRNNNGGYNNQGNYNNRRSGGGNRREDRDGNYRNDRNNNYRDDNRNTRNYRSDLELFDIFRTQESIKNEKASRIKEIIEQEIEKFVSAFKKEYDNKHNRGQIPYAFKNSVVNSMFLEKFTKLLKDGELDRCKDSLQLFVSFILLSNINNIDNDDVKKIKKWYVEQNKKYIKKISKIIKTESKVFGEAVSFVIPKYENLNLRVNYASYTLLNIIYDFSDNIIPEVATENEEDSRNEKVEQNIAKLFEFLFEGEILDDFLINVLLEKKSNLQRLQGNKKIMWNRITNAVLEIIKNKEKDDIKELLKKYAYRRKSTPDIERRLRIVSHLNPEDYKKILKQAKKIIKEDKIFQELLD